MSEVANLKTIETLDRSPFKYMVATIGNLPTSFVDSMSYYECIAWLIKYLETEVIPTVNNNSKVAIELQEKFVELKYYVEHYFDNLDVQEEIDNKLDQMYDDGQLSEIIVEFLKLKGILGYDTVASMKAATEIVNGSLVETYGFYAKGDGGGAKYIIRTITNQDVVDEETIFALYDQTLVAELVAEDEMNILQFGIVGDGTTDLSAKLNKVLSYRGNNHIKINFNQGETYLAQNNVYLYSNTELNLNGATIKSCHDGDDTDYIEFGNGLRLLNNEASVETAGYGAIENIEVYNGTFDGYESGVGIFILHGLNIKFHDLIFKDCCVGTHVFDLGGCKNVEIKNCDFNGYLISNPSNNYREMVQFDYATRSGMPYWGYSGDEFDGLPCVNFTVDNCEFSKGTGTYYPTGVGSHSGTIYHHQNITIKNCRFNRTSNYCIRLPKVKYAYIKDNIIDCQGGTGIFCQTFNSTAEDNISEYIYIENNTIFSNGNYKQAIRLAGMNVNGSIIYIQNVILKNNNLTNTETVSLDVNSIALSICNAQNITIDDNTFTNYKHVGLKDNSSIFRNSIICKNKCVNCLYYITATGSESDAILSECTGIEQYDNIWSDSENGTFNINNFKLYLSCSEGATRTATGQNYVMCPLDQRSSTIGEFDTGSNYRYHIPACVSKIKVTGVMNISSGNNTSYKVVRINGNVNGEFTRVVSTKELLPANTQHTTTLSYVFDSNRLRKTSESWFVGFDAYLDQNDSIVNAYGPGASSYLIIEGC